MDGTKADNINLTAPAIGVITGAWREGYRRLQEQGVATVASLLPSKEQSDPKFIQDVGGVFGAAAKGQLANVAKGQVPIAGNMTKGVGGPLKGK